MKKSTFSTETPTQEKAGHLYIKKGTLKNNIHKRINFLKNFHNTFVEVNLKGMYNKKVDYSFDPINSKGRFKV